MLGFPSFIARRVYFSKSNPFTGVIIKIATVSVAFAITVMFLASVIVNGFQKNVSEKIFGFWGHVHIMHYDSNEIFESTPISKKQDFYPSLDTLSQIHLKKPLKVLGINTGIEVNGTSHGGIDKIFPYIYKTGIIKTKNQFEGIVLKGVDKDYDWQRLQQYIVEGDNDLHISDSVRAKGIIISKETSNRMKLGLGDKVNTYFIKGELQVAKQFKVTGIYNNTGADHYNKRFAIIDLKHLQQLNGWSSDQVSGFEIILEDVRDMDDYARYINYSMTGFDLFVRTIKSINQNMFIWLELHDKTKIMVMTLMFVVALINVIIALIILILERTKMIGTLKSLGSSSWQIQKIFLIYAFFIISAGVLIGNAIGLCFSFIQGKYKILGLDSANYYLDYIPVQLDWREIITINLLTIFTILLVLIIPTFIISKISPVKTLRFK